MTSIINYGSGNIRAIGNIYERLNIPFRIIDNPADVEGSDRLILPGVGAFDETISILDKSGFRGVLDEAVLEKGTPVLGICVGMQILAEHSEEGSLPGLGWIKGRVKKIDPTQFTHKPTIPHLGWNAIEVVGNGYLFQEIDPDQGFYFMHSYYFQCERNEDIMTTTSYGSDFASSINHKNIFGVQFHPEKSHQNGINLLKNFSSINA